MENQNISAITLAKYLTQQLLNKGYSATNLKIQKMLWYCQIWWWVKHRERLLIENFKPWMLGVVIPIVWYKQVDIFNERNATRLFDSEVLNLPMKNQCKIMVEQLIKLKGKCDGLILSAENHKQKPWIEGRKKGWNSIIEFESIKDNAEEIYKKYLSNASQQE